MKLSQADARIFVPDGEPEERALARTTHLGIGAHPDDLELMTWHGIAACFARGDRWFSGAVVTDGANSPRAGRYGACSDDEMRAIRMREQSEAAGLGQYASMAMLAHRSESIVGRTNHELVFDLVALLKATRPFIVYTHNLFDAHDTHVAVSLHTIAALRCLSDEELPQAVYGCEGWRSLDWLPEGYRVTFDVSGCEELATSLMAVHDSQIGGGKRYDRATLARKRAHATYGQPRRVDTATSVELALDLTPLVRDRERDVLAFAREILDRFSADVSAGLSGT